MGMFDTICVSDQLPLTEEMTSLGLNLANREFQTKDLDNVLGLYFIQNGKLYRQCYTHVEETNTTENPHARLFSPERGEPYLQEIKHHGEIYFYDYVNDVADKYDCWVEYKATITHGLVDKIELFKFTKEDNTQRKLNEKALAEKMERESKIWYNKYFFHTKFYRWFSHRVWYRTFYKLGSFFHSIAYKL
jgi:hypothetical protein